MTQSTQTTTTCPECDSKTTRVKPITIESLVVDEARAKLTDTGGFRFCPSPDCDTAYFHPETELRISKNHVKVRIGQKETASPRPVCYCFSHTVEEIEAEVRATGASKTADAITAKCRQGLDRCEETNPQGRCCLGNVRAAMAAVQPGTSPESTGSGEATGCCASPPPASPPTPPTVERAGTWASLGALASAALSSVCCWLPLALVGFGVSAGSVAGALDAYRPWFLGATGVLLSGAFYLTYFRKAACAPDGSCAAPRPKLQLFNKITLWVATIAVSAFAFFPNYVGLFLTGNDPAPAPAPAQATETLETVSLQIEGMTCEACTVHIRSELEKVGGVRHVRVSFDASRATIQAAPGVDEQALLGAVEKAGYRAVRAEKAQ